MYVYCDDCGSVFATMEDAKKGVPMQEFPHLKELEVSLKDALDSEYVDAIYILQGDKYIKLRDL